MDSPNHLIPATLTALGGQIVSKQIELKLIQGEIRGLLNELDELEAIEAQLMREVKGLKQKALWEQHQFEQLHGLGPDGEPRHDVEGEGWKRVGE